MTISSDNNLVPYIGNRYPIVPRKPDPIAVHQDAYPIDHHRNPIRRHALERLQSYPQPARMHAQAMSYTDSGATLALEPNMIGVWVDTYV